MAAKILIRRQFKNGVTPEILSILTDLRAGARRQPGYISGETLINPEDSTALLVIATWENMRNWYAWKENTQRQQLEAMLDIYQTGATDYEEYVSQ